MDLVRQIEETIRAARAADEADHRAALAVPEPFHDCHSCGLTRPDEAYNLQRQQQNLGPTDRPQNGIFNCSTCLRGQTTERKCRGSCRSLLPLDAYDDDVSGRSHYWLICKACRSRDGDRSRRHRTRLMDAVTVGYLCPVFTSYVLAASPWKTYATPPDIVTLAPGKPRSADLVGTYDVVFYVGSKVDIGPKIFSRKETAGTVELGIGEKGEFVGRVRLGKWSTLSVSVEEPSCVGGGNRKRRVRDAKDDDDDAHVSDTGDRMETDEDSVGSIGTDTSGALEEEAETITPKVQAHGLDVNSLSFNYYAPQHGEIRFVESTPKDQEEFEAMKEADDPHNRRGIRPPTNSLAIKIASPGQQPATNATGSSSSSNNDAYLRDRVSGFVQSVATRAAIPRIRDDRFCKAMWHKVGPDNAITVREGERRMSNYRNMSNSWLRLRLGLPEPAALAVRRFLQPEPVFFFEPGDLWLRFAAFERLRGTRHPAVIVARRKKNDQKEE